MCFKLPRTPTTFAQYLECHECIKIKKKCLIYSLNYFPKIHVFIYLKMLKDVPTLHKLFTNFRARFHGSFTVKCTAPFLVITPTPLAAATVSVLGEPQNSSQHPSSAKMRQSDDEAVEDDIEWRSSLVDSLSVSPGTTTTGKVKAKGVKPEGRRGMWFCRV